ncbi:MAG: hemolysin, partial [Rickettsiaceae bacterium]|nr:hemolysin [Rickettsiaceae bacterium]
SGNNMTLNVVNNLTNNSGAAIFALGDLTIQKYDPTNINYNPTNNKTGTLTNISASIESYLGDTRIEAETINNRREYLPTQGTENYYTYQDGFTFNYVHPNHYWIWRFYRSEMQGSAAPEAIINSGNNLTINTGTLNNNSSSIYAANDITINATSNNTSSLNNQSNLFRDYVKQTHQRIETGFAEVLLQYHYTGNLTVNGISYDNKAYNYAANIKAGHNLNGTITGNINNDTIAGNTANIHSVTDQQGQITNSINPTTIANTGTVNIDIGNYLTTATNNANQSGLFTKSTNPNAPLFETRSQFIDQGQFFASDYFYQKIGLNLTDLQNQMAQQHQRLVGDQFFQSRIIEEQLRTISKTSFLLSESETNITNEIKTLLDNAADEYARLGLNYNQNLSRDQINQLQKDIVWFEIQTIDGAPYIVPKIYLTQATRDRIKSDNTNQLNNGSTIYAGNNLNLNSSTGTITNRGSIIARNNINFAASGNILNQNFSSVFALNNLSIASGAGNITNLSQLRAINNLSLTATKDITNSSTILTNDINLLNSNSTAYVGNGMSTTDQRNIRSTLFETANITAGSLTINAGENFNNQAANINSSGDTTITAGNNINIETLQLRNRSESRWGSRKKGGTSINDELRNVASNIEIGGGLNLASGANTNIIGSNLNVADDLNVNTAGDLNILSAQDTSYKYSAIWKKGNSTFGSNSKSSSSTTSSTTNIASNINVGGDLTSNSQGNINILASNIASDKNITMVAGNEVNILSGQDINYAKSESSKKGATVRKSSIDIDYKITNIASNLLANGGDINISSGDNTNIIASNLSGENGNIIVGKYIDQNSSSPTFGLEMINDNAKLVIKSGEDYSYKYHYDMKIKTDSTAVVVGAVAAVAAVAAAPFTAGASMAVYAGAAAGGAATGAQGKKGKTTATEITEITQIKSNLNFTNDLNIQSSGDTEIKASNLSANNATILTGKFRDQNTGIEDIVNIDSQLKLESAFDSKKTETAVERVRPNYVGIAVVSGATALISYALTTPVGSMGPQIPIIPSSIATPVGFGYTVYSGASNMNPNQKSLIDHLINIRSKDNSSNYKQNEIKTDLHFNNLITQ